MKLSKPHFLAGLALLFSLNTGVASPASPDSVPTYADMVRQQWTWINQKWTDSDKPYLQERNRIAALYRARKIGPQQLQKVKAQSLARPKNSVARFTWAYSVYCYSLLQADRSTASGYVGDVSRAMAVRPSPTASIRAPFVGPATPNSYQYARLRFLIACSSGGEGGFPYGNGTYLRQLGERLLKRDPKDQGVKAFQIVNLRTGKPEDERKAIRYAHEMVTANPKDAGSYITLGFTYQYTYIGRKGNGPQLAIAAYQRALQLNKTPGKWRQSTQNNINDLQKLVDAKS